MRGKIEVLGAGALQGRIRAEDGSRIPFDLSGILAYDVGRLCVGHSVTFDVDKRASTAINVSREQETAVPPEKRPGEAQLRYMGFEQTAGVRTYRFERVVPSEGSRIIIVTIDVKLFVKHRIGMQEGPTLCLRHLAIPENTTLENQILTDADMLAFIASKPAAGPSRAFRRKHSPPSAASQPGVEGPVRPALPQHDRTSLWPPRRLPNV